MKLNFEIKFAVTVKTLKEQGKASKDRTATIIGFQEGVKHEGFPRIIPNTGSRFFRSIQIFAGKNATQGYTKKATTVLLR